MKAKNQSKRLLTTMRPVYIAAAIILLVFACKKEPVSPPPTELYVVLESGEEFSYDLLTGDEEGGEITIQASNFERSEIVRDATTNYSAVYYYMPVEGYVGTDFVQIERTSAEIGSGDTSEETSVIRINLTINE